MPHDQFGGHLVSAKFLEETTTMRIPFNRPALVGRELENICAAIAAGHLSGGGSFTNECHTWLEQRTGASKALLTHSCTAALEMAAILSNVQPGDEVIMPSYTFASTANAFVLRGGVPVFVDIRDDTLNIDVDHVEGAITDRTRVIVPVHYAGVACDMDEILAIARDHDLLVIEDAAQALMSTYRSKPLGSIGHLAAVSFHETKNIISGEGGALLINDERFAARAEVIREKGTNRSSFFRGEVDKYSWVDIGSSFLPSEIVAAFLFAQMQEADSLTSRRLAIWQSYHAAFDDIEALGLVRRPVIPSHCTHNAHLYHLLLPTALARSIVLHELKRIGIGAIFHYVPLHTSPAGLRYGRAMGPLPVTSDISQRLLRLPLWPGIEPFVDDVILAIRDVIYRSCGV